MAVHSRIGASTCERWWNCPGSVALVNTLPPQRESEYAAEGTAAHELAERCLRDGVDAAELIGELSKNGFVWDDEMAEHVQTYLDVIRHDISLYDCLSDDLSIEHKFHLTEIHPEAFGTCDAILRVFLKKVIVYDLKYGQGVAVEAEDNKQGQYYALGGLEGGDYEEVEVVIVQPRAKHKEGPVRRFQTTRTALEEFGQELKTKAENTQKKNAELCAGRWCKKTFCPAMAVCPAIRKQVEIIAKDVFAEVEQIDLPKPEALTPLELRRALDSAELLDQWIKAVKSYAYSLAIMGKEVVDYKLVRGNPGNRKWNDEAEVIKTFSDTGDELYNKKLKSPAQLEKVVGKERVKAFVIRAEGKLELVPRSDERTAIAKDADSAFAKIENQQIE